MKAKFVRFDWENRAHTIASFYFKPDKPYFFTAGQYADLTIPHEPADNRGLTRTMTFTSMPDNPLLKVTMRIPVPMGSYKQALLALQPGTEVSLTDAMGDMVLPLDTSTPLVFVAGGVGIASYVSMILWLTARREGRDITLLYAVRGTDDIIFQDIFDTYAAVGKLKKILYTSDDSVDSGVWQGTVTNKRLTADDILQCTGSDAQIYLSGTEAMVTQLQEELTRQYRLPQYRIAFDYFEGYTEL